MALIFCRHQLCPPPGLPTWSSCLKIRQADGKELMKCSGGCQGLARYCCREHQKAHWGRHKVRLCEQVNRQPHVSPEGPTFLHPARPQSFVYFEKRYFAREPADMPRPSRPWTPPNS